MGELGACLMALGGMNDEAEMLANATNFLSAFGHTVLGFLWLDIAVRLAGDESDFAAGKRAAMRYFYGFEMPKVTAWLAPVAGRETLTVTMKDHWF
jgi:butyryl-CoA dehydrogenase